MKKTLLIFLSILLISVVVRFVHLGSIPMGFSWDEAAIGYNGYGIFTVHRDEWLNKMPVSFKSFGDYKAAVAIYATAITTTLFGLNSFATRFPMAFAGVVTTASIYFIALRIFKKEQSALLAMLFVAVSPLNVHFSRIAFESGIAVACVSLMVALFLYAKERPYLYIASSLAGVMGLYAYHSTKIALPLIALILLFTFWKQLMQHKIWIVLAIVVSGLAVYPLFKDSIQGKGAERLYMTSAIMNKDGLLPVTKILSVVSSNFMAHLNPNFLIFGKAETYRHGNNAFGIFSYIEFCLFIVGVIAVVGNIGGARKYTWLLLMILAGLVPALISTEAPHSNRAHGMIPWTQLVAALGGVMLYSSLRSEKAQKIVLGLFAFLFIVQTIFSIQIYTRIYTSTPAVKEFQYGYVEAVKFAVEHESEVDKVLFTSAFGQPYIYVLFGKQLTPIEYQQGALANYEIRDLDWNQDKNRTRVLIVGTPKEIPSDAPNVVREIKYPDGSVALRIVQQ